MKIRLGGMYIKKEPTFFLREEHFWNTEDAVIITAIKKTVIRFEGAVIVEVKITAGNEKYDSEDFKDKFIPLESYEVEI